jgi:2'-5' RNA ligase
VRCFIALDLPDVVREALDVTQGQLRAAAPRADVRWVAAAGMHLTLKFLGEVSDERLGDVRAALDRVTAETAPMELRCAGLGVFPGPSRPRVIWAGMATGLRELGLLAHALEGAVEPLGFLPERRPFRGHATLGRVRSPRGIGPLMRALERASGEEFGRWTASQIVLYRSHLRRTGSIYEPLARVPLAGAVAST